MSQNRSTAVMQQRHEAHDSLDDFPTPPWATRALCEWIGQREPTMPNMMVREPAANRGFMVRPLAEYFGRVIASDVHDYGVGYPVDDYLFPGADRSADWTITNPPFRLAEEFIHRARESGGSVAVILRGAFLEGVGRYERLYARTPPTDVLQFAERVPMVKGRYDPKASTATTYSWLVWLTRPELGAQTRLHWIPPCRKRLERPDDARTPDPSNSPAVSPGQLTAAPTADQRR